MIKTCRRLADLNWHEITEQCFQNITQIALNMTTERYDQ